MCELFISANPDLWESKTRSIRIDGVVTSIRLEHFFWRTLEEIGARDGMSVAQLVTRLYGEAIEHGHDPGNFTSFLRVCSARYLNLISLGELSGDLNDAIADAPAKEILAREEVRLKGGAIYRHRAGRAVNRERAGRVLV